MIGMKEARKSLSQLVKEVKTKNARYLLSVRGKPQAVLFSLEDFLQNIVKTPNIMVKLQKTARKKGLHRLTMDDIDREIRTYRRERREQK
jgi:prevent-host-death family protein